MTELKKQLQECGKELRLARRVSLHFKELQKKLTEEENQLLLMSQVLTKEHKEVAALEGKSLKALYHKLRGDRHIKIEKENDDYQRALVRFTELYKSVELLRYEFNLIAAKVTDPQEIKDRLEILVAEREKELLLTDPINGATLKAMNCELHRLDLLNQNLNHTYTHIKKVMSSLKKIETHFIRSHATHVNLMYNDIQFMRKNVEKGNKLVDVLLKGVDKIYDSITPGLPFLLNDYKKYITDFFEFNNQAINGNTRIDTILEEIIFIRDLLIKTINQIKVEIKTSRAEIKKIQKNKTKVVLKS